jgi:hypothetical protein
MNRPHAFYPYGEVCGKVRRVAGEIVAVCTRPRYRADGQLSRHRVHWMEAPHFPKVTWR